jgi:uncharacterized protein (UPF0303 family)
VLVFVLFKKGLDYTVHDSKIDQNGRYIILDISLFDQRLTFVSLYGYNSDEPEMFNEIMKNIAFYSKTSYFYWGALTPGILSTIWKTGSPWI